MFLTSELSYIVGEEDIAITVKAPGSVDLGKLYEVLTTVDKGVNPFLKFAEAAEILRPLVVSAPDLPEATLDKVLYAISQQIITDCTTIPDVKKK